MSKYRVPAVITALIATAMMAMSITFASDQEASQCFTVAVLDQGLMPADDPESSLQRLAAQTAADSSRVHGRESLRFAAIHEAAILATTRSDASNEDLVFETPRDAAVAGEFWLRRGSDGWTIQGLRVELPMEFCQARE